MAREAIHNRIHTREYIRREIHNRIYTREKIQRETHDRIYTRDKNSTNLIPKISLHRAPFPARHTDGKSADGRQE
jgi:hypothetical protein